MEPVSESSKYEEVVRRIDQRATLLLAWRLTGGVSAEVIALEIEYPDGERQKLIVRRHGAVDLSRNPNIAADEFKLLQRLQLTDVAAPKPIFLDVTGHIFPTPYLVMAFVEGKTTFAAPDMADILHQMAGVLAKIHGIDGAGSVFSFPPTKTTGFGERPETLDESLSEGRIRAALASAQPFRPRNQPVLLHGDYWPGNLLWQAGKLVAVIDWEDARVGDPLADVANARLEVLWAYGGDAMQSFTRAYRAMSAVDYTQLPYWDLCAALRPAGKLGAWGLATDVEGAMREAHGWFVDQALDQLACG